MAARKPLFMNEAEGFQEEMALTDSMSLGGLSMSGNITMGGDPTSGVGGNRVTGVGAPVNPGDVATKSYVDANSQGLDIKGHCTVLADSNTTLSGLLTIDGHTLVDGERVLLTNQTDGIENGIWVAHSAAWTRPSDYDTGASAAGNFTFVTNGTTYADQGWVCTTDSPDDIVDTDETTWVQFSSAGVITAGEGLVKVGNEISVKAGDGIEVSSNGQATNLNLAADPGLVLSGTSPNKQLKALVSTAGGLQIDGANGLAAKLNGSTLQSAASGLSVKGVPSSFEVNGVATAYAAPGTGQVTADNLNLLTAGSGSNADALHTHSAAVATEAPKVESTMTVNEAIAIGDAVYITNTNNRVGKADTSDSKAKVVGVARTAQSTPGSTCEVVNAGLCTGCLSAATAGDAYYLQTGGTISTALPVGGGKRVIQVGIALNATDLFVRILDYGKKAA